jgi:hypothetical protein
MHVLPPSQVVSPCAYLKVVYQLVGAHIMKLVFDVKSIGNRKR